MTFFKNIFAKNFFFPSKNGQDFPTKQKKSKKNNNKLAGHPLDRKQKQARVEGIHTIHTQLVFTNPCFIGEK